MLKASIAAAAFLTCCLGNPSNAAEVGYTVEFGRSTRNISHGRTVSKGVTRGEFRSDTTSKAKGNGSKTKTTSWDRGSYRQTSRSSNRFSGQDFNGFGSVSIFAR